MGKAARRTTLEVPSETAVYQELEALQADLGSYGAAWDDFVEVRLVVRPEGNWEICWGDPSTDLDHRGYWGSSSIGASDSEADLRATAMALVDDVEEAIACGACV